MGHAHRWRFRERELPGEQESRIEYVCGTCGAVEPLVVYGVRTPSKLDAHRGTWEAVCSCGWTGAIGTEAKAREAARQHYTAKHEGGEDGSGD